MIFKHPPLAVLNARRKGCKALLNIDESDGIIPVIRTIGAKGDRIGYKICRHINIYNTINVSNYF